jgi:hypothetical protein
MILEAAKGEGLSGIALHSALSAVSGGLAGLAVTNLTFTVGATIGLMSCIAATSTLIACKILSPQSDPDRIESTSHACYLGLTVKLLSHYGVTAITGQLSFLAIQLLLAAVPMVIILCLLEPEQRAADPVAA